MGIKTLPGNLMEAMEEFLKDSVLVETIGEHIVEKLVDAKKKEWEDFRIHVTDWELKRYLCIY